MKMTRRTLATHSRSASLWSIYMRRVLSCCLFLLLLVARLNQTSLAGTNEDWQASFVDSARVIHKLVDLKNFAIYWDSAAPPLRFDHIQVRATVILGCRQWDFLVCWTRCYAAHRS